jgi:hypothetical protein
VFWVWSVEAQVYALGLLAISWATYWLFNGEDSRKWLRVGLLHAGAALGHVIHILWIVPALYWLWIEGPAARRQNLRRYLIPLVLGVAIPYSLVIGGLVLPGHLQDRWPMKWLMGSAALNPNSVFQWHASGWNGPLVWALTTLKVFWGSFWPYQTDVPAWGWALTLISGLPLAALLGLSLHEQKDRRWVFCMLWLAVYGIFFWTWEPATECYRMTDLIPLGILMAFGLKTLKRAAPYAVLTVLFLSFFALNLRTRIYPMQDARRNTLYQETLALANATPDQSLYLTAGQTPWIYLLYFSGRTAWNLHSLQRDPLRLESEVARGVSTRPVFIRKDAISLTGPWLARHKLLPVGDSLPWLQVR